MEDIRDIKKDEYKSIDKMVKVTGVGYENSDGSGIQTTYKKDFEVKLIRELKGEKYPYLVEYNGETRRYFKNVR